jgi:hypothetical protein
MARPLLPHGLLDEFRQHTWVSPVSPETAIDRLLDWLEEHPADAARLLPRLIPRANPAGPLTRGVDYRCTCLYQAHPDGRSNGSLMLIHLRAPECPAHRR